MTEPSEEEFQEALDSEDELGIVVRAHIHIEHQLIRIVESLMPVLEELRKMELDYEKLVHISIALGLKEEHRPPLLAFGKVRNDFAHKLRARIDKNRVNNLYKSFSADDRDLIVRSHELTKKKLNKDLPKFRSLSPRDQFVLMAVTLRSMLMGARAQLEEKKRITKAMESDT